MKEALQAIAVILGAIIAVLIVVILCMGLSALIYWGVGCFIIWAFGINFVWTFWHGMAVALLIGIISSTLTIKIKGA